jgi:hypothetical protein
MNPKAILPAIGFMLPVVLLISACGDSPKTAGAAASQTNPPDMVPPASMSSVPNVTQQFASLSPAQVDQLIGQMLSYLPANQVQEFEQALFPALNKDPSLVTDGLKILQDAANAKADPNDQNARNSLLQEGFAYEARLRTTMTAIDPNLGPVFNVIDLNLKM